MMRTKLLAIGLAIVLVSTAFGVSAFTSGQVTRSSNVAVVADDSGLIGLKDGTSADQVDMNNTGALTFDATRNTSASGVNTHGHFEWGNPSNANQTYAFSVTNNDQISHSFTFEYTGSFDDDGDTDKNIEFRIYNSTGSHLVTASEESSSVSVTLSSDETVYVVIVIDTYGVGTTGDLSGTLTISA